MGRPCSVRISAPRWASVDNSFPFPGLRQASPWANLAPTRWASKHWAFQRGPPLLASRGGERISAQERSRGEQRTKGRTSRGSGEGSEGGAEDGDSRRNAISLNWLRIVRARGTPPCSKCWSPVSVGDAASL